MTQPEIVIFLFRKNDRICEILRFGGPDDISPAFREFHSCIKYGFLGIGSGVKENVSVTEGVNVLIEPLRVTVLGGFPTI